MWLSRNEAAQYLRVHVTTIDRWVREGRITKYTGTDGLALARFKRDELDALLAPAKATAPE